MNQIIDVSILALIAFGLGYRTLKYNFIIDDIVKRTGYYTVGVVVPPWKFFDMKPTKLERLAIVAIHFVCVFTIYLLWGFIPALIFALHPMTVWGYAWMTGSFYATAAMFTLIAYYFVHTFPSWWGALIGMIFYNAAINSAICPVSFPFLAVFEPWIATFFIMMFWLFKSKRFKDGIKVRNANFDKPCPKDWKRLFVMVKVVARYIYETLIPRRPSLFCGFGHDCRDNQEQYDKMHKADALFWASLSLCIVVFIAGLLVNPFAICWFFVIVGLHSQWGLTGQFYAQRYIYLPLVGMVVVLAGYYEALKHIPLFQWAFVAYLTWLLTKTNAFIPTFKNFALLLRNDIKFHPEYFYTYNNLAIHLMHTGGDMNEAVALLLKAKRISPKAWETDYNMSKACMHLGEWKTALEYTEEGIRNVDNQEMRDDLLKRKREVEEEIKKREKA